MIEVEERRALIETTPRFPHHHRDNEREWMEESQMGETAAAIVMIRVRDETKARTMGKDHIDKAEVEVET